MIGGPSVSVLTAEEIRVLFRVSDVRVLFRVSDVRALADLLPHDLYADADDGGRAASPEDFGLEGLGFGGSAVVMAHPDDPSRVLLDDIEPRNILRRDDGTIVLNDPDSFMSVSHIRDFKDRFAVADEAALTM